MSCRHTVHCRACRVSTLAQAHACTVHGVSLNETNAMQMCSCACCRVGLSLCVCVCVCAVAHSHRHTCCAHAHAQTSKRLVYVHHTPNIPHLHPLVCLTYLLTGHLHTKRKGKASNHKFKTRNRLPRKTMHALSSTHLQFHRPTMQRE